MIDECPVIPGLRVRLPAEVLALMLLIEDRDITQGECADVLGINLALISKLVSDAVDLGLVARVRSRTDHRFRYVRLTPKGQRMRKKRRASKDG